jgi:molecular chaperone DnaK (HSP70)
MFRGQTRRPRHHIAARRRSVSGSRTITNIGSIGSHGTEQTPNNDQNNSKNNQPANQTDLKTSPRAPQPVQSSTLTLPTHSSPSKPPVNPPDPRFKSSQKKLSTNAPKLFFPNPPLPKSLTTQRRSIVQYLRTRIQLKDDQYMPQGTPYAYSVGIELGVDFSSIAVAHSLRDVQIAPNPLGFDQTPSLAFVDARSPLQINGGYPTDLGFKGRVFSHFRDLLGRSDVKSVDDLVALGIDESMYQIDQKTGQIVTADQNKYQIDQLLRPILDGLIQDAHQFSGQIQIPHIVIATPVWWNAEQRAVLGQMCQDVGVPNPKFIHEPVAVCLANNIGKEANKTVLVYHVTQSSRIEISILQADKGVFSVLTSTVAQLDPLNTQHNMNQDPDYRVQLLHQQHLLNQYHRKKPQNTDEILFSFFHEEINKQTGIDLNELNNPICEEVFLNSYSRFKREISDQTFATFDLSRMPQDITPPLPNLSNNDIQDPFDSALQTEFNRFVSNPKNASQKPPKNASQHSPNIQNDSDDFFDHIPTTTSPSQNTTSNPDRYKFKRQKMEQLREIATKLRSFKYTLTQSQYAELTSPITHEYIRPITASLSKLSIQPIDIDTIVMSGQVGDHPLLQNLIESFFGRPVISNIDPIKAIVTGAAMHSALVSGKIKTPNIYEKTPLSMGISLPDDKYLPLIPSGASLPFTQLFTIDTNKDDQTSLDINFFTGERDNCRDNAFLGHLRLDGIPKAQAAQKRIKVILNATERGVLNVIAQELSTGTTKAQSYQLPLFSEHQFALVSQRDSWENQHFQDFNDKFFFGQKKTRIIIDPTSIMTLGNNRHQDILELSNPKYKLLELTKADFLRYSELNGFKMQKIIKTILANYGLSGAFDNDLRPYNKDILNPIGNDAIIQDDGNVDTLKPKLLQKTPFFRFFKKYQKHFDDFKNDRSDPILDSIPSMLVSTNPNIVEPDQKTLNSIVGGMRRALSSSGRKTYQNFPQNPNPKTLPEYIKQTLVNILTKPMMPGTRATTDELDPKTGEYKIRRPALGNSGMSVSAPLGAVLNSSGKPIEAHHIRNHEAHLHHNDRGFDHSDDPFDTNAQRKAQDVKDYDHAQRIRDWEKLYNKDQLRYLQSRGINPHIALNPENEEQRLRHEMVLRYMDTVEYSQEQKLAIITREANEHIGRSTAFFEKFRTFLQPEEEREFHTLIDVVKTMLKERDINLIELALFQLQNKLETLQRLTLERQSEVKEWVDQKRYEIIQYTDLSQRRAMMEEAKAADLKRQKKRKILRKMRSRGINIYELGDDAMDSDQLVADYEEAQNKARGRDESDTSTEEHEDILEKWGQMDEPTTEDTEYPIDPNLPPFAQHQILEQNIQKAMRRYDPQNATKLYQFRVKKRFQRDAKAWAAEKHNEEEWEMLRHVAELDGQNIDLQAENDAALKRIQDRFLPLAGLNQEDTWASRRKKEREELFAALEKPPPRDPRLQYPPGLFNHIKQTSIDDVPADPFAPAATWSNPGTWSTMQLLYKQGIIPERNMLDHYGGEIPTHWDQSMLPYNLKSEQYDRHVNWMRRETYKHALNAKWRLDKFIQAAKHAYFDQVMDSYGVSTMRELSPDVISTAESGFSELLSDWRTERVRRKRQNVRRHDRAYRRSIGINNVSEDTVSEQEEIENMLSLKPGNNSLENGQNGQNDQSDQSDENIGDKNPYKDEVMQLGKKTKAKFLSKNSHAAKEKKMVVDELKRLRDIEDAEVEEHFKISPKDTQEQKKEKFEGKAEIYRQLNESRADEDKKVENKYPNQNGNNNNNNDDNDNDDVELDSEDYRDLLSQMGEKHSSNSLKSLVKPAIFDDNNYLQTHPNKITRKLSSTYNDMLKVRKINEFGVPDRLQSAKIPKRTHAQKNEDLIAKFHGDEKKQLPNTKYRRDPNDPDKFLPELKQSNGVNIVDVETDFDLSGGDYGPGGPSNDEQDYNDLEYIEKPWLSFEDRIRLLFPTPAAYQHAKDFSHIKTMWQSYAVWKKDNKIKRAVKIDEIRRKVRRERYQKLLELEKDKFLTWRDDSRELRRLGAPGTFGEQESLIAPSAITSNEDIANWFMRRNYGLGRADPQTPERVDRAEKYRRFKLDLKRRGAKEMTPQEHHEAYGHLIQPLTPNASFLRLAHKYRGRGVEFEVGWEDRQNQSDLDTIFASQREMRRLNRYLTKSKPNKQRDWLGDDSEIDEPNKLNYGFYQGYTKGLRAWQNPWKLDRSEEAYTISDWLIHHSLDLELRNYLTREFDHSNEFYQWVYPTLGNANPFVHKKATPPRSMPMRAPSKQGFATRRWPAMHISKVVSNLKEREAYNQEQQDQAEAQDWLRQFGQKKQPSPPEADDQPDGGGPPESPDVPKGPRAPTGGGGPRGPQPGPESGGGGGGGVGAYFGKPKPSGKKPPSFDHPGSRLTRGPDSDQPTDGTGGGGGGARYPGFMQKPTWMSDEEYARKMKILSRFQKKERYDPYKRSSPITTSLDANGMLEGGVYSVPKGTHQYPQIFRRSVGANVSEQLKETEFIKKHGYSSIVIKEAKKRAAKKRGEKIEDGSSEVEIPEDLKYRYDDGRGSASDIYGMGNIFRQREKEEQDLFQKVQKNSSIYGYEIDQEGLERDRRIKEREQGGENEFLQYLPRRYWNAERYGRPSDDEEGQEEEKKRQEERGDPKFRRYKSAPSPPIMDPYNPKEPMKPDHPNYKQMLDKQIAMQKRKKEELPQYELNDELERRPAWDDNELSDNFDDFGGKGGRRDMKTGKYYREGQKPTDWDKNKKGNKWFGAV